MVLGPIIGAAGSLLGGIFGNRSANRAAREQAAAAERANAMLRALGEEGRRETDRLALESPDHQIYAPAGQRAFGNYQALLGLGGDREAADAAFDNYLNSTAFRFALDTGGDAITGSRAARGLLGSGRTGTALTEFGQNLGRQYMDNYLNRLGGVADIGIDAGRRVTDMRERGVGRLLQPLTGQAANVIDSGRQSASLRQQGAGDLWSGIGGAYGQLREGGVFRRLGWG